LSASLLHEEERIFGFHRIICFLLVPDEYFELLGNASQPRAATTAGEIIEPNSWAAACMKGRKNRGKGVGEIWGNKQYGASHKHCLAWGRKQPAPSLLL
jgi:hypothetical protein